MYEVVAECLFCSKLITGTSNGSIEYGTFIEHIRSQHKNIKISDEVPPTFKAIWNYIDSAEGINCLCIKCGYKGRPKVKSSRNISAKNLGEFGTCFPLCFMVYIKHLKRHHVKVICTCCNTVIRKINEK
ncbi:uncharacterized protein LOC114130127 isoform X1 [Aphis gossypii]|uniref:uncharacterized protein LOC114130127 isoform X1 n=1 Tax=Aphis gossypii TaxID=80765 RepID=UPI002158B7B6|nr:uncharacterized protein LOC114130127 isoform X1 [Aphis gossypii]